MEVIKIIEHANSLRKLADSILESHHQVEQFKKLRLEKNWIFYTQAEAEKEIMRYESVLRNKEQKLEKLKTKYLNELLKLHDDSNKIKN